MKVIKINRGNIRLEEWNEKILIRNGLFMGQSKTRWNPNVSGFLIGSYKERHLVDLDVLRNRVKKMLNLVKSIIKNKGRIIIGNNNTKNTKIIEYLLKKSKQPYINAQYKEGGFTHARHYTKLIKRLEARKEKSLNTKKLIKQTKLLMRLRKERKLRDGIVILNARKGHTLIAESNKLGLLSIGFLTTNLKVEKVNYGIIANGEHIKIRTFILLVLMHSTLDATIEGPNKFLKVKGEILKQQIVEICDKVLKRGC